MLWLKCHALLTFTLDGDGLPSFYLTINSITIEPVHEISNNVVCATRKASDQPAQTHSLIRAFASGLSIL